MGTPKISKFFIEAHCAEKSRYHGKETRTGFEKRLPFVTKEVLRGSDIRADLQDGRESEVWEIELDKSLPSQDMSLSDQGQEAQNTILKAHINKRTVKNSLPGIDPDDEIQLANSHRSHLRDSSPEQSDLLEHCAPPSLAPSYSASQRFNHGLEVIESITHQRETSQRSDKHRHVSHTSPTFHFRPMRNTNHMFTFPAIHSPVAPNYDKGDDECRAQGAEEMLTGGPEAAAEPNYKDTWNMDTDDLDDPAHNSPNFMMEGYLDDYPLDDEEDCCWEDESNQDLDPHEHRMYETADLFHQDELAAYETYLGVGQGQRAYVYDPGYPGSFSTEEWSAIQREDGNESLRTGPLTRHSAEDWSELNAEAVSLSELPTYEPTETAFIQGRSLLLGIEDPIMHNDADVPESVEREVTLRLLRDHWLPQKL
ncbi:hypothetical protein JB92DRAFT_2904727 [Gautieria morchelliformis]|nr:hypothetical protein JB92DRAFT_2904727 [Gautieria morchelliformis]